MRTTQRAKQRPDIAISRPSICSVRSDCQSARNDVTLKYILNTTHLPQLPSSTHLPHLPSSADRPLYLRRADRPDFLLALAVPCRFIPLLSGRIERPLDMRHSSRRFNRGPEVEIFLGSPSMSAETGTIRVAL